MRRRSLRLRVAFLFASFGAFLSLLLSAGVYLSMHDFGQRLMEETLQAEMLDYDARLKRNPWAQLPATLTLSGYAAIPGQTNDHVPQPLLKLAPGKHEVVLAGVTYLALVSELPDRRLAFLFNETLQIQREHHLLYYLVVGMLVMTTLSAAGGLWLAGRIVAPVTALVEKVAADEPGGAATGGDDAAADEIDELSRAFDRYNMKIRASVEHERAFTADVSHELRTPLAVIRGAIEVLDEDAGLNERQRQRVARIDRASRDMVGLTSALLHLARVESGMATEADTCSIAEIISEAIERQQALTHNGRVAIHFERRAEPPIQAERVLASVVVDNLIANAITHSETGSVHVKLEARTLIVTDRGKGIAETELDRVFQRHFKGAASKGSGIGLSLVKRICDLYHWKIDLSSRPGEGTQVSLRWS